MPAYVIYEAEVVDAVGYEAYKTAAAASIAAAGGRYIVRGGAVEALEVDAPVGRTIVLEFPSMQVALDWYHSDEYTEVRKLRDGVAHARLFIVDGVDTAHSGNMRGARFEAVDLTGARFRDADLRDVKVADSFLAGANLSGYIAGLRINEVDVAPLVEAELDRRHPERALMRNITNADGMREAWTVLEERWAATVERARGLPEPALHERVDEEWSFVETLRHLVFATDAWVGRPILGETRPYHPMGLPPTGFDDPSWMGIDLTVTPTFDEALVGPARTHGHGAAHHRGVDASRVRSHVHAEFGRGVPAPNLLFGRLRPRHRRGRRVGSSPIRGARPRGARSAESLMIPERDVDCGETYERERRKLVELMGTLDAAAAGGAGARDARVVGAGRVGSPRRYHR